MNKKDNINAVLKLLGENLSASNVDFEIIQDEGSLNTNELKIGLLSGFCVWSGYTFEIGKRVIDELSSELANNEVGHYLLDCDFISVELQEKLFRSNRWGYFESCWIENGEILKSYKYKYELEPFLLFVKNRLKQISGYFDNKTLKSYALNSEKQNFGIEKEAFISKKEAIILSKSKYKNQFLYNLMSYQKKGDYYLFEDDELTIYEETTPTHLSSCFVRIKEDKKREGST